MPRPKKTGLDYFPFDCDFFEDEKIVAIAGEFGIKGELAAIKLLCAIYRNGYFIEWSEMLKLKMLQKLPGISSELFDQILNRLVRWGFFDASLFGSVKVLTSVGIQRRYFNIVKRCKLDYDMPYLLLEHPRQKAPKNDIERDVEKRVKNPEFGVNVTKTPVNVTKTPVNVTETPQSKVNKIKEKKSTIVDQKKTGDDDWINLVIGLKDSNSQWKEALCMKNHIREDEIPDYLDRFVLHIITIGEESTVQDVSEIKKRFTYWLPSEIKRKQYEQVGTNRVDTSKGGIPIRGRVTPAYGLKRRNSGRKE